MSGEKIRINILVITADYSFTVLQIFILNN